jgi:hypothetical protein
MSTFAEELGQYEVNPEGELVDRYHGLNSYFVAKSGDRDDLDQQHGTLLH